MIPQSLSRTEHPRNLTSRFRRFVLKSQLKDVARGLSHKEYKVMLMLYIRLFLH